MPRPYREDPQILEHIQAALQRGVRVRAIVDRGKYDALASEQANLVHYLTSAGGQLHLSNPAFPRSFPKIILVDSRLLRDAAASVQSDPSHLQDLGSISLSPDSITFNREMGLISRQRVLVRKLEGAVPVGLRLADHEILSGRTIESCTR